MDLNTLTSMPRNRLFWLLQLCGWSVYAFIFMWDNIFFNIEDNTPNIHIVGIFVLFALIGVLFTLSLRAIYRRLEYLSILKLIPICAIVCFTFALAWTASKKLIIWTTLYPQMLGQWLVGDFPVQRLFSFYSNSFFIFAVWTAFYLSIKLHFRLIEQTKKISEIQTDNERSKFQLLRYQLNPHFLFNSLNAASNLALGGDGERTNEVLAKLSSFLRFSLDISPDEKMSLKQDFNVMAAYLEIEKIRFGKRLEVDWQVAAEANTMKIPSFLIQPLIENTIKHAVSNNKNTTTISIRAKQIENQKLLLEVTDDGPLTDIAKLNNSEGIGLVNIQQRLNLFYGDNAELKFEVNQPHGMKCIIIIDDIT